VKSLLKNMLRAKVKIESTVPIASDYFKNF